MEAILFYNSERLPVIQWDNFFLEIREKERFVNFNIKARISIFEASTKHEMDMMSLVTLRNHILLLYQQRLSKVVYVSSDELMRVELKPENGGHIRQYFDIMEEKTKSCLKIVSSFDQTFIPELIDGIDTVLEKLDYREE